MSGDDPLERWIHAHLERVPLRSRSLIVTVFGDSIEPHGGTVWMGSLIRLLEPLGLRERSVRTSVFRLVQEGWLEAAGTRIGKRSFYRMTPGGRQRAAHAHRRIYDEVSQSWNGQWTLLLLEHGASAALRHDLHWQGFGRFLPQLYGHPAPDARVLQEILETHGPQERITAFRADALEFSGAESVSSMVQRGWPLKDLARQYDGFVRTFADLKSLLQNRSCSAQQDFLLRTLLIHEFRRAQLRDPRLPSPLLPDRWPGTAARDLCKALYLMCTAGAEQHLVELAEGPDGPLRPPAPYFFERFGGTALTAT